MKVASLLYLLASSFASSYSQNPLNVTATSSSTNITVKWGAIKSVYPVNYTVYVHTSELPIGCGINQNSISTTEVTLTKTNHNFALRPNTEYYLTVCVQNANMTTYKSQITQATVPAKPSSPQRIKSTSSSITIKWNESVEGHLSRTYTVTWTPDVGSKRNISGANTTITGLQSNTKYTFVLAAVNKAGASVSSNSTAMSTDPAKANSPQFTSSTSSSITMKWNEVVEGSLDRTYTVTWNPASPSGVIKKEHITGLSTTITGLQSNKKYYFSLAAANIVGKGQMSLTTLMQTTPGRPLSLRISYSYSNTTHTLQAAWRRPAGGNAVNSFVVQWEKNGESWKNSTAIHFIPTKTTFEYKITNVTQGSSYVIRVLVNNAAGWNTTLNKTVSGIPGVIRNFTIRRSVSHPSTRFDLSWNFTSGAGNNISVTYTTRNLTNHSHFRSTERKGWLEVAPGNNYTVSVATQTQLGSNTQKTEFISSAPSSLKNVTVTPSAVGLRLSWSKLKGRANKIVIEYTRKGKTQVIKVSPGLTSYDLNRSRKIEIYPIKFYSEIIGVDGKILKSGVVVKIKSPSGMPIAQIIGIVVGVLFVVVPLVIVFLLRKRLFHKITPEETTEISFQCHIKVPENEKKNIFLSEFQFYMMRMHENNDQGFREEFQKLSSIGTEQSTEIASLSENKKKNRYKNILPYDTTRVKLTPSDKVLWSDYINASFITSIIRGKYYIATQGPLESTKTDFWNMVWQQNSRIVVMLTGIVEAGKQKCSKYWPENVEEFEGITVKKISETSSSLYTTTVFLLTKKNRRRSIRHFHFTAWPDKAVPYKPLDLVEFINNIHATTRQVKSKGPTIVHCSAGVGRTGTFIAVDQLLELMKYQDYIDIFSTVYQMRLERTMMVQTKEQYIFIHKVVEEVLNQSEGFSNANFSDSFVESVPETPI